MGKFSDHISRRRLLAGGTVLLTGTMASVVAKQTESSSGDESQSSIGSQSRTENQSQSSTGNRLLVKNPTDNPQLFTLSVSSQPISAYRITDKNGKTETVKDEGEIDVQDMVDDVVGDEDENTGKEERDDGEFQFTMQATRIRPKDNVVFDQAYTLEPGSEHVFQFRNVPERGELLYTLQPKATGATTVIETWGTIGCSSQFEVYLSPSETRSSCGGQLSEFDGVGSAKQHTVRL